jgi:hypothetical protein
LTRSKTPEYFGVGEFIAAIMIEVNKPLKTLINSFSKQVVVFWKQVLASNSCRVAADEFISSFISRRGVPDD